MVYLKLIEIDLTHKPGSMPLLIYSKSRLGKCSHENAVPEKPGLVLVNKSKIKLFY